MHLETPILALELNPDRATRSSFDLAREVPDILADGTFDRYRQAQMQCRCFRKRWGGSDQTEQRKKQAKSTLVHNCLPIADSILLYSFGHCDAYLPHETDAG